MSPIIDPVDFADLAVAAPPQPVFQRRDTEEKLDGLKLERQTIQDEKQRVEEELTRIKQPREVWIGAGVLLYFSVVGIVWPVLVMAGLEVAHSPDWRAWLVAAFASGLLALMAFIGYAIRRLQK